ncbi:TetR/AcrR family transcriptional regulator [Ralstonia pseudosolanacearum]|uniref:TetR/AcrR family transcriptional regulator n=1 Tax=Ralstonia solanacearum TaxID=305 RepID=A0AA92ID35_RALSL|nr:TetR/AcrR family transcriptional regulator [Ralstonia pseudosolanacearum]QCX48303.1 TetR/AcrR family transcriptional regulator [Ralstonia pseudosolanacearum]
MSKHPEPVSAEGTEARHDTRDRILDAGGELILGRGFSAVGLAEILGRAQVPKGSFYYYFDSKEDFGVALLERYFQDYDAGVVSLFNDTRMTARERLLRYFTAWIDLHERSACEVTCLAVKLSGEVSDLSEPMRKVLSAGMTRMVERIAAALQAGVADGSLAPVAHPRGLAEGLYAMWVGGALLAKAHRSIAPLQGCLAQTEGWLIGPKH